MFDGILSLTGIAFLKVCVAPSRPLSSKSVSPFGQTSQLWLKEAGAGMPSSLSEEPPSLSTPDITEPSTKSKSDHLYQSGVRFAKGLNRAKDSLDSQPNTDFSIQPNCW